MAIIIISVQHYKLTDLKHEREQGRGVEGKGEEKREGKGEKEVDIFTSEIQS